MNSATLIYLTEQIEALIAIPILIGGYGPFGVGRMWSNESEEDKNYSGYNEARIVTQAEINEAKLARANAELEAATLKVKKLKEKK